MKIDKTSREKTNGGEGEKWEAPLRMHLENAPLSSGPLVQNLSASEKEKKREKHQGEAKKETDKGDEARGSK